MAENTGVAIPKSISSAASTPSATSRIKGVGKATLAAVAVDLATRYAEQAYTAASEYFNKSGVDIKELANAKSKEVQATVVDVLLRKGMPVELIESANLDSKELKMYASLLNKYRVDNAGLVSAANAANQASTGSKELDRIAKNLDIEAICVGLGITSSTYALILRGLNSHTEDDIEAFQLHRQMYGLRAI
jgi:hypothetical protein